MADFSLPVIPGRIEDASPQSITTIVSMDSDAPHRPGMTTRLAIVTKVTKLHLLQVVMLHHITIQNQAIYTN
jgi:hypothetical protein